jgi:tRNA(fMet)-specific endonuclease VapC
MLDTNICIALIRGRSDHALQRLQSKRVGQVCVSSITVAELEAGAARSQWPEQARSALAQFLASLEIAAFDEAAAQAYGNVRGGLERLGTPIGPLDTLIAAHAIALECTIVTNNVREFARVPDLQVEDWLGV